MSRAVNFGDFVDGKSSQPLAPVLSSSEAKIGDFQTQCHNLCLRLLRLFALGLQVSRRVPIKLAIWYKYFSRLSQALEERIGSLQGMTDPKDLPVALFDGSRYAISPFLVLLSLLSRQ